MQLSKVQKNEFAKQINELDALAKTHATKAVDYARQAGAMLLKVKGELPHGQWVAWVEENLTMSIRQVQRYIAVSQGKPIPVRHLADKNDTVSFSEVPHPAGFKPSWRPTPGHWHCTVWDHAAYWVIPDQYGTGFHVSKLYVEDRSLAEEDWQTLFSGTKGAVKPDYVDWYLKSFGLPFADKLDWTVMEREGAERPFGEPSRASEYRD